MTRYGIIGRLVLALAGMLAGTAQAAATTDRYVDIGSVLRNDEQINAWYGLTYNLARNFDDICGDTFCEGDYSNIQALRFACSVDASTGLIGQCVWSFAASAEEVVAKNGRIKVDVPHWRCVAPLAPNTRVEEFLQALGGDEPLYAPLPWTTRSLYDGLVDCL